MIDTLFKKACERCEEHASNGQCECMMQCPVYGLYVEAKKKTNVVQRVGGWAIHPSPKPEML